MRHLATTLIGALTLYAIAPQGLAAAPPQDLRREVVRFADLDLTRPPGVQELYRRIQHAARRVCPTYRPGVYDHRCADQAIARALADVGAPLLTARYAPLVQGQTLQPQLPRADR